MIGTRLGPYDITAALGAGGMGEVYRARDTRLDREVAIKVLPAAFTQDAERLARFEREAKLLAQLHHPNIASIFGLEDADGVRALVMELVEGPTLADRLEGGALGTTESLRIALAVTHALEAAHEKGIVHRDLKPQNIKAPVDEPVKVLDFGLAKAMDPAGSNPGAASGSQLAQSPTMTLGATEFGVILGTAAYMAPEQAKGLAVDKRGDVWAFGVILHEMLTGERLFAGDTVPETLAAVIRSDIDLSKLPREVPPSIRRLLRRCLERQPKNRLRDIGDARLVIEDVLAGRADDASVPAAAADAVPVWRRWVPWIAGASVGLAAGLLLAPRFGSNSGPQSASVPTIRMLVADGESFHPDVSPDGKTLAFGSERNGEARIWLKDLVSGSESALSRSPAWFPRFSPDGTSVLFSTEAEALRVDLYRIALATREERLVVRNADAGDWSPDGRSVLFLRGGGTSSSRGLGYSELVNMDSTTGAEKILHRDSEGSMELARWSAAGDRIAVWFRAPQTGSTSSIGVLDAGSGALVTHPLRLGGLSGVPLTGMAWLSERRLALLLLDEGGTVTRSGRVAVLDVAAGTLTSVLPLPAVGSGLTVAGPGELIVGAGSGEQNLREVRRNSSGWSEPAMLTAGPFSDRQPVYSPDGRFILFTSNRSGNLDIWRLSRESGELRRLTDHEATDWDPTFSRDGTRLLFSSNRSGRYQVWMADADGSSPRQVTDLENAQNPTFAGDDGGWIVFTLQDAGPERNGLWRVRLDGSEPTRIATGLQLIPETSLDGRFVAFRSQPEDGKRLLRVMDGQALDVSIPFTDRYRWSTSAAITHLWAIRLDPQGNSILRYPFDPVRESLGRPEAVLAGGAAAEAESLGVARDGSAFAFSTIANRRQQLLRLDGLADLTDER